MCLCSRIYLIWHPHDWRGARLFNIPFVKQYLCLPKFLQVVFLYLIKNSVLYAAIMMLWLVAFPGFLIISGVSGIVNTVSLIVPAVPCLLILGSVEAIIIAQWAQ